eukprot:1744068-Prymnesium_polylepis.1
MGPAQDSPGSRDRRRPVAARRGGQAREQVGVLRDERARTHAQGPVVHRSVAHRVRISSAHLCSTWPRSNMLRETD